MLAPISLIGLRRGVEGDPPVRTRRSASRSTGRGATFLAIATLGFLLFLERGSSAGFGDPFALGLIAVSAAGLGAFVAVEHRAPAPMLRLDYFRRPNFTGPLIAQPLSQFAYMGAFLIAPLLLDELFGYSVGDHRARAARTPAGVQRLVTDRWTARHHRR